MHPEIMLSFYLLEKIIVLKRIYLKDKNIDPFTGTEIWLKWTIFWQKVSFCERYTNVAI